MSLYCANAEPESKQEWEPSAMAKWVKCTDEKSQTVWVNLDNVTNMTRHEKPRLSTEIIFVGGGQIYARERPEDIIRE